MVMAKVHLTPLSRSSISTLPGIELNVAKLVVELRLRIVSEIQFHFGSVYFWYDSILLFRITYQIVVDFRTLYQAVYSTFVIILMWNNGSMFQIPNTKSS